jgi:hypothetical protein
MEWDEGEILHAFLVGNDEKCVRLIEQLREAGGLAEFGVLFSTAFVVAVRRRFGPNRPAAEITRFVSSLPARPGEDIDPRAAEYLIRAALGEAPADGLDDNTKAIQVNLLDYLIADEKLDESALEEFLAQVRAHPLLRAGQQHHDQQRS